MSIPKLCEWQIPLKLVVTNIIGLASNFVGCFFLESNFAYILASFKTNVDCTLSSFSEGLSNFNMHTLLICNLIYFPEIKIHL